MIRGLSRLAAAFALSAALALGACAPTTERPTVDSAASSAEAKLQSRLAFENFQTLRHRVNNVSHRVLAAGADMCGDQLRWGHGFTLSTIDMFAASLQTGARETGLGSDIRVTAIAPGSPAEAAGIVVGDTIVRLGEGPDLPAGKPGLEAADKLLKESTGAPLLVAVRRGDGTVTLASKPERVCSYPVITQVDGRLNAFADGSKIVMFTGMVKFAATDEELALIVGHELAHNIRDHIGSKRTNAFLGFLLDAVVAGLTGVNPNVFSQAGANANSPEFEAEADYVGLYILTRAGFPIDKAPEFWRRMAVENPGGISHTSTHPATNDRFVALQAAIAEIEAKRAAGAPLVPNEKKVVTTVEPPK